MLKTLSDLYSLCYIGKDEAASANSGQDNGILIDRHVD